MKKVQRRLFKNAFSILQEIKRQNVALMTILLFFYGTMEKLEQGHLNPKLEVPRLTCLRWESNPGLHGAWRGAKLFLNSFIIAIWNIYI
jgi:hypothetical protein